MKARMGAVRALSLGAAAAMMTTGLSAGAGVAAPSARVAAKTLPDPTSTSWLVVKKGGNPQGDPTNDYATASINLTPAGGALGNATAFVSADLVDAYFRVHVAAAPVAADNAGYIVQFDIDNDTKGWERALRFDPNDGTVTIYTSAAANSAPKADGTVSASFPLAAGESAIYAGADGGAFVAFSVPRSRLATAGILLGRPMAFGVSSVAGPGIDTGGLLGIGAKADILGSGKGAATWANVASDPLDIDSDGDGFPDNADNCPVIPNPGQEDDDKTLDNSLPMGTPGQPDGTEGLGNVCDPTPRGYDHDGDNVGYLDDQCKEQYGLLANGCPAQSTTTAILRYKAKKRVFSGSISVDIDQCLERRNILVYKLGPGPDKQIAKTKTDAIGMYSVKVAKRPKAGKYYASVDPKWTLGARCFGVRSPKIKVS